MLFQNMPGYFRLGLDRSCNPG